MFWIVMRWHVFVLLLLSCVACLSAVADDKVAITEDTNSFTLDNGIVLARVSKRSGNLTELVYKNLQMFDDRRGSSGGYWSYDVSRQQRTSRITIEPNSNGGQRGEVSVRGMFSGRLLGGPATDLEFRYSLARGDTALYAYCEFSHPTNYPATAIGEA